MTLTQIEHAAATFTNDSDLNYIPSDKALSPDLVGVKMFDAPIIAVAEANDLGFGVLQTEGVVGAHHTVPSDWVPGAKSVIALFFPFTEEIRLGNRLDMSYPSNGWLNARIEGQRFVAECSRHLVELITQAGYAAVAPALDERLKMGHNTSNWSERHVAFVCGLGSFGLSAGFITERGTAGRFASVVTSLALDAPEKEERGVYANCLMCGKCARNCPVGAINVEHGKDHDKCGAFLDRVREDHAPWYGCGKCQVAVPCESRNPVRRKG